MMPSSHDYTELTSLLAILNVWDGPSFGEQ